MSTEDPLVRQKPRGIYQIRFWMIPLDSFWNDLDLYWWSHSFWSHLHTQPVNFSETVLACETTAGKNHWKTTSTASPCFFLLTLKVESHLLHGTQQRPPWGVLTSFWLLQGALISGTMVAMRQKQNDGKFFQTTKRGEIQELKDPVFFLD